MSEPVKRSIGDIDPDYQDLADQQAKRQRVIEKDAQQASVDTIRRIVSAQFEEELQLKEETAKEADKRLNEARIKMDRLRAVIVASFYSRQQQNPGKAQNDSTVPAPSIHPTAKRHLGKAPVGTSMDMELSAPQPVPSSFPSSTAQRLSQASASTSNAEKSCDSTERKGSGSGSSSQTSNSAPAPSTPLTGPSTQDDYRLSLKRTVIVGNCSRFLLPHQRQAGNPSTHKWMVYVRGSRDSPNISDIVSKVWFFLHPSYRPHDLVEIKEPPYHLSRQGWGEFPVRVQLHFRDTRNKRMDIIHNLVLDKTYTGLQTLGAETVVSVDLVRDPTPCPPRSSQTSVPETSDHVVIEADVRQEPELMETDTQQCQYPSLSNQSSVSVCALHNRGRNVTILEQQADTTHNHDNTMTSKKQQSDTATHNTQKCQCAARNIINSTCVCAPDKITNQEQPAHQAGVEGTVTVKEEPPDDEGGAVCSCLQSADTHSGRVIKREPCNEAQAHNSQASILSSSHAGGVNPGTVPSEEISDPIEQKVISLSCEKQEDFDETQSHNSQAIIHSSSRIGSVDPETLKISDPTEQRQLSLVRCVKQEASDETQCISHGTDQSMHSSSRVDIADTTITSKTKETLHSTQQKTVSLLSCPPANPASAVSGNQVLVGNTLPRIVTTGASLLSFVPASNKRVVAGSGQVPQTVNSRAVSLLKPAQVAAKPTVGVPITRPLMKVTAQGLRPLRVPVTSVPPPLKFAVNIPQVSGQTVPRLSASNPPPLTLINTPVSTQSVSLLGRNNLPASTLKVKSSVSSNQAISLLGTNLPSSTPTQSFSLLGTKNRSPSTPIVNSPSVNAQSISLLGTNNHSTSTSTQAISLLESNNLPPLKPIVNSPSVSNQAIPVLNASTPPPLRPMIVKSSTVGDLSVIPIAAITARPHVLQARSSSGTTQGPVMKSLLKMAPKPGVQVALQQSSTSTPRSVQSNPQTSAITHSLLTTAPQNTLASSESSGPCIIAKMNMKNIVVQLGPGQTNQDLKSMNDLIPPHVDGKIVAPPKHSGQFKMPVTVKVMPNTTTPTIKVMPNTTTPTIKVMPSTNTPPTVMPNTPTVTVQPTTTTPSHQRQNSESGITASSNLFHRTLPPTTASGNPDITPTHYKSRAGLELERAKASLEVQALLSRSAQLAKLKALADKKLVMDELPPPKPRSTRWFSQGLRCVGSIGGGRNMGDVDRGGQMGVSISGVKVEIVSGVNDSVVKLDEFAPSGVKQEGINVSQVKQEGVTAFGIKQEGFNTARVKQEGVNASGFKQFKVMSEVKQEGVNTTLDRGPGHLLGVSGSMVDTEKKIMVFKKMKTSGWLETALTGSPVPSLSLNDYSNMASLVKAAILRHPLLAPSTEKMVHPYCARSLAHWYTWHPAKRNAAEWSRAAAVRRYLQAYLNGADSFKGEQLWSTKRIMVWCRLHGLSPNKPGGRPLPQQEDRTIPSDLQHWDNRLVSSSDFHLLSSLFHPENKTGESTEDTTEVEIMDVESPPHTAGRRVKEEPVHVDPNLHFDFLTTTPEAHFVQDTAAQVGVKFAPAVVAPGVFSSTAEDMLFGAMLEFATDLLHHACASSLSSPSHSPSPIVSIREVVQATTTLPAASFLGNKYCGLPNAPASPTKR